MGRDHSIIINGNALNLYDHGILITGMAGIGKSDVSLDLISRGHKFIADDSVMVTQESKQIVMLNLLEEYIIYIRDIGFIDIELLYGKCAVLHKSSLEIIIELNNQQSNNTDITKSRYSNILNQKILIFELTIGKYKRPLSCLIEMIVMNWIQTKNNHNSHDEFIKFHRNWLTNG